MQTPDTLYSMLLRRGEVVLDSNYSEVVPRLRAMAKRDGFHFGQSTKRDPHRRKSVTVWLDDGHGNIIRPAIEALSHPFEAGTGYSDVCKHCGRHLSEHTDRED